MTDLVPDEVNHGNIREDLAKTLGALQKPRRVSVSQGASEILVLSDPGGYSGPWQKSMVPYLVKPMDELASRHYESVCFVGPARTGKTAGLILGWMAHAVCNDIGRMMIVHMTADKASQLSKLDVEPAIEASPKWREFKSPSPHDNNINMKVFRHGMAVKFAYPTPAHLAGFTYRYMALTDYDRFPSFRGGGEVYDTAHKRTETAMSRRMTLVESSPERDIEDPLWRPATPHEAPPCGGILGIYNRGDRQRWHWPCPHCGEYFEAKPGLELFATLPDADELIANIRDIDINRFAVKHSSIWCPCCGSEIESKHKFDMNARGMWVADGQRVVNGKLEGEALTSRIASFWLGGVAAAYQSWEGIVRQYLYGLQQYALSGSEETLRKSVFTDQAMPYLPRALLEGTEVPPEERAEDHRQYFVPNWARFLVATVDVQGGVKSSFVVQVHAVGEYLEQAIVDRYTIEDGPRGKDKQIDPSTYSEDWDVLTEKVVDNVTYRLENGKELLVHAVGVDSGGEKGVSHHAYAWYKRLRQRGLHHRVYLLKGEGRHLLTLTKQSFGRDARGRKMRDVPLYLVDSNAVKNVVAAQMRRLTPGPGYMHFPKWLKRGFYEELKAERRDKNGKWVKVRERNEAFDLWMYVVAVCHILGPANELKTFDWVHAPGWARPLDGGNTGVVTADERRDMKPATKKPRRLKTGMGRDEWVL